MTDSTRILPKIIEFYQDYLDDGDVERFVARTGRLYMQGTLCRLLKHADPRVRRAAALALGFLGDFAANPSLGEALRDSDRPVRLLAEEAIRNVWLRPGIPGLERELRILNRMASARLFRRVVERATTLLQTAKNVPEVYYLRANALMAEDRYEEAIRDHHMALELNPYHFLAAAGMGYAYLKLRNFRGALEAFRRALKINPNLEAVRLEVNRLRRLLGETS
ncbi:MAG: tetratricopeptide repeat protein [Thermoguttaceae bacterium]|nr:tetratricopeptide repeat protein [Thermoguttaceae bacterium]MDW8077928.1 tetratricopeptide repeat protein [Thermoguttaceae bacterium]